MSRRFFLIRSFINRDPTILYYPYFTYQIRYCLKENGNDLVKVIAKIERPGALDRIDEIIQAADAIMVARGTAPQAYIYIYISYANLQVSITKLRNDNNGTKVIWVWRFLHGVSRLLRSR